MPHYLTRKADTYYFRQAVQAERRSILDQRESKKLLGHLRAAWTTRALPSKRIGCWPMLAPNNFYCAAPSAHRDGV